MLRVSIHAGPAREVSRFNRVDWLDIGYEELALWRDDQRDSARQSS